MARGSANRAARQPGLLRGGQRLAGLAVLAAAAAIGLAACSGSSAPPIASLGQSSSRPANTSSPGAALAQGNPARLLNQWAACMRSHGDPDQATPTVDASQVIRVVQPAGYYGTMYGPTGQSNSGAGVTCQAYLTAASTALRRGQPLPQPDQAQIARYTACLRASGVLGFPGDGSAPGTPNAVPAAGQIPGPAGHSDVNLFSPAFEKAARACAKKTGGGFPAGGTTMPGEIELIAPDGSVREVIF